MNLYFIIIIVHFLIINLMKKCSLKCEMFGNHPGQLPPKKISSGTFQACQSQFPPNKNRTLHTTKPTFVALCLHKMIHLRHDCTRSYLEDHKSRHLFKRTCMLLLIILSFCILWKETERAAKHEGKGFVVNREQCHHYTITGGECSTHTHSYDYIIL